MAREDVNIKVSANVAEAIRLWKAMEAGPEGMARELGGLETKGKKAAQGLGAEFDKFIGKWTSIAAGIAIAKQAMDAFIASHKESMALERDSTLNADQMSRELFQLSPGNIPLQQIRQDILSVAERRSASPERAKEAIAALLGADFSYDQTMKKGGGADAVLTTMAATNATGKNIDAKELVDAITGHLSATGQDKTSANLLNVGMAVQGLFAATKLEIEDLKSLAPRAKNISDATGLQNEQIAIMSQFKDVTTADVGATAFHSAISRLVQAPNNSRVRRGLSQIGLSPDDVRFDGTPGGFMAVQQRLANAFDSAPNAAASKGLIFGNEGMLAGNVLFSQAGVAQTRERMGMAADAASFDGSAEVMAGGFQGKQNAADAREMMANAKGAGYVDPVLARQEMLSTLKRDKMAGGDRVVAEKLFDLTNFLTGDAERAAAVALFPIYGADHSEKASQIANNARAEAVKIKLELTDQNGVSIPHKSEVHKVGTNKPSRGK